MNGDYYRIADISQGGGPATRYRTAEGGWFTNKDLDALDLQGDSHFFNSEGTPLQEGALWQDCQTFLDWEPPEIFGDLAFDEIEIGSSAEYLQLLFEFNLGMEP